MKSVSIKAALTSLFCLMIMMIGGLGYMAITKISDVNENVTAFSNHWLPARDLIGRINVGLGRIRILEAQHMVSASAEDMAAAERRIAEFKEQVSKNLAAAQRLANEDSLVRAFEIAADETRVLRKFAETIFGSLPQGRRKHAGDRQAI